MRGGFYGEQPSLTDLDDGDLKPTTDFRDVYAALLAELLTTDPARILDGHATQLPLLQMRRHGWKRGGCRSGVMRRNRHESGAVVTIPAHGLYEGMDAGPAQPT